MEHFGLIVEFELRAEHADTFHRLLAENARASVAGEPGCRQFDVLHLADDPLRVVLYEIYDSDDAFAVHMAAPHTRRFLAAAKELVVQQTARRLVRTLAPAKAAR